MLAELKEKRRAYREANRDRIKEKQRILNLLKTTNPEPHLQIEKEAEG